MKILLFGSDPRFKGGIAQYNHYLAEAIIAEGHELLFIGFEQQYPSLIYPTDDKNREEDSFSEKSYEVVRTLPSLPFLNRKTEKIVREFQPAVVIIPWWVWWWFPVSRALIKNTPHAKHIIIAHNILHHEEKFPHFQLSKFTISKMVKMADLTVVHSSETEREAKEQGASETILLPHPVYPQFQSDVSKEDARKELGFSSDETLFLFYGIVRHYKGVDLAIQAIAEVSDARLIIAGEVWDESLKDEIKNNSQVTLMDSYIPTERAKLLFAATDAFVLPYRSVTGSGVAAAVLPLGKPVVCSDLPLFSDYFPSEMCFSFTSGSAPHLAEMMREVKKELKNSNFLLNLESASARIARQRSWKSHINAIVSHKGCNNE
ncbi:glycosyltransferase [bacterium]|nr:glycosyltransferase [bacterium]